MNIKPSILTLAMAVIAIANTSNSFAEGFRNPTSGAINLGRSGGRIAHVDNASAITQNPANLMDLKRPEVTVSFNPVYISVEHQNASGATAETENAWKFLPAAYASMPILDDKYVIGLGITSPYGLSNEWKNAGGFADTANQGSLRYTTPHFSELQTILVNPTVAFDVSEKVSMGLGLDTQWSQLTFKQHVFPNGRFVAESDGIGAVSNLGMTWKITDRHLLAFTARSPITVDYDGDFNMNVPSAGLN